MRPEITAPHKFVGNELGRPEDAQRGRAKEGAHQSSGTPPSRRIRSFVRRQGRITAAQRAALAELWPRFGLDPGLAFDPLAVFGRRVPLTLEIGFGDGEGLVEMASASPNEDFLGVEVHTPGVGHLLLQLEKRGLGNVRVYCADAVEVLERCIPDASLERILVLFPDPWPKKRHHKRRLVTPEFACLAAAKLTAEGLLHAATDWEDYAHWMLEALNGCAEIENLAEDGGFSPRPEYRRLTKFEQRGRRLGHAVWDLVFRRPAEAGRR
ncbi:MAG TPA: tRNA (guanosine(46)-N7)-methyltransferase TrmB [Methylococcus sp.]|nr:tRNA (guanosine(46)-N7)-methyltransferase TrmB [Methylococcus sp.]